MTELSFLLELVLTEKLSKGVKEKILARVKEIETMRPQLPMQMTPQVLPPARVIDGAVQSPSTVAAMQRQQVAQNIQGSTIGPNEQGPGAIMQRQQVAQNIQGSTIGPNEQGPGAIVVASQAAAQAIQSRELALSQAISGKPEPGRTSPRKF